MLGVGKLDKAGRLSRYASRSGELRVSHMLRAGDDGGDDMSE